jgi:ferritin-like protein
MSPIDIDCTPLSAYYYILIIHDVTGMRGQAKKALREEA